MEGTSPPRSPSGDGADSSNSEVWSSSLRDRDFSIHDTWSNRQPPSDLPYLRQETLPSNTTNLPVDTISRHPTFADPPTPVTFDDFADLDFDFLDPGFGSGGDPFSNTVTLGYDGQEDEDAAPDPDSLLDFDPASPTPTQLSWNFLSSDPESDDPHFITSSQRQRTQPASTPSGSLNRPPSTSNNIVDLTEEPSPRSRMPSASSQRGPNKRRRLDSDSAAPSPRLSQRRRTATHPSVVLPHVEEVDLRDVDDDKGLSKVLEEQRMATVKAQQEEASKPVKLATLQCIICMDLMKDVTATYCGHLFCHSCLMEALIAGENQGAEPGKGPSKCPVCRKKIKRPGTGKRDLGQVIALEVKVKKRTDKGKGKERRGSTPKEKAASGLKRKASTTVAVAVAVEDVHDDVQMWV